MQTRRAALLTIAGAAATPLIAQQGAAAHAGHEMAEAVPTVLSFEPVYFKQADYAVVSRLADLILPRTDTPGALDTHVPYRIDHEVAASPVLQKQFDDGLAVLQAEAKAAGAADFVAMTEAQQISILKAMSDEQGSFFQTVKGLTVDWYYRSEEGLVKELGFHGNTFRAEFPGCTHPEHWPTATQESK